MGKQNKTTKVRGTVSNNLQPMSVPLFALVLYPNDSLFFRKCGMLFIIYPTLRYNLSLKLRIHKRVMRMRNALRVIQQKSNNMLKPSDASIYPSA